MENIILIVVVGILMLLSFYLGSRTKTEKKVITTLNPIEKIKEIKENRESKEEFDKQEKINQTNIENIENYNGSGYGQKDFLD